MKPRVPVSGEALLDPEMIDKMVKEKGAIVFTFIDPADLLKHVDVFSYETLQKHTVEHILEECKIQVISVAYLLKLKQDIDPPRDKDRLDIRVLTKLVEQQND